MRVWRNISRGVHGVGYNLPPAKKGLVAFDLEGPLSPQDNAYELMGLMEDGYELFERLSRYDDILTLEEREDYEPGDTLYLILPFLILNEVGKREIEEVSKKAPFTPGAKETIQRLKERYKVVIISTSYVPHAHYIGNALGVEDIDIACTPYPFEENLKDKILSHEKETIEDYKKRILGIPIEDESALKGLLNEFYLKILPKLHLHKMFSDIKVMGGRRKVDALRSFVSRGGFEPLEVVCIGDSITDFRMLKYVKENGGLSIVFNGNEYAIPYAVAGVASMKLEAVIPLIERFFQGGILSVKESIKDTVPAEEIQYQWLEDYLSLDDVISVHKLFRRRLRGRAAQLG